jgi:ring-1,2-phenylacetyl-CoA epoxidase subunit PaaE
MSASFHTLRIAEIVPETADAKSIRFDVPEELRSAFAFRPGQHLTLKADIAGEDVRRNYSLCVAPQDGQLKVTVKRIAGGVFSNWANDNLKPGDPMEVMEPHGSFTREFRADARFLEELAALKNRFMNRLQIHHFLAEEAEEIELFNGMLDRTKCDLILGSLIEPEEISAFFICGPGPMMDAAEEALTAVGVAADRILVERFTAGRPSAALAAQMQELQTQAAGLTMQVTLDGRTRRVAFNAEAGNILDSARLAGLPAPFACKAGVCATCRGRVTKGEVEMAARYGLSDQEIAAGYVLTCQSVPKGEGVEVDYDA